MYLILEIGLISLLIISTFFRTLKFLSLIQQKEYRLDRLVSYFSSYINYQDFLYFLPSLENLKNKSFKRPKITFRIIFLFLIVIFLCLISIYFVSTFSLIVKLIIINVFSPLLVFISIFPSSIFSILITNIYANLAKNKIERNKPIVIGITGSYGKSTTKALLDYVLSKKYSVFSTPKSYNTTYSICKSVVDGYKNQEIAIIEFAAYKKGEIAKTASYIKPNLAIITGLTFQHLKLFGTIEDVIKAKSELVASLNNDSFVFCNSYNLQTKEIVELGSENLTLNKKYLDKKESLTNTDSFFVDDDGYLNFSFGREKIQTKLLGIHNQELVKIVVAVAKHFDLSDKEIAEKIKTFIPDERFITVKKISSNIKLIDDGKTSNKVGFISAINLADNIKVDYKILITSGIVDLGTESEKIHTELAKKSNKVFDKVFHFGLDGKHEFMKELGEKFFENTEEFEAMKKSISKNKDKNCLILIEGFIPKNIKI